MDDHFGEGFRRGKQKSESNLARFAGKSTEEDENRVQGMKVGKLTGENYRESSDPAADTRTQRAWLYGSDPSLTHVHHGGKRPPAPRENNELSLPLGDGAMSKVRADLKERKGLLYRTATHITKGNGHRTGMSVFQDG